MTLPMPKGRGFTANVTKRMVKKLLYDNYGGYEEEYEPSLVADPEWDDCMNEGQWGFEEEEE